MFHAMNRFDVQLAHCDAFESRWLDRESRLHAFEGFVEFNLLRGPDRDEGRLYVSHTVWQSEADFQTWLRSPRFREAHARPERSSDQAEPQLVTRSNFEALSTIQHIRGGERP